MQFLTGSQYLDHAFFLKGLQQLLMSFASIHSTACKNLLKSVQQAGFGWTKFSVAAKPEASKPRSNEAKPVYNLLHLQCR